MNAISTTNFRRMTPIVGLFVAGLSVLTATVNAVATKIIFAPPLVVAVTTLAAILLAAAAITLIVKIRNPQNISVNKVDFKAHVDIQSLVCGIFGKASEQQGMPKYLKELCMDDGTPLVIEEKDLIVECDISEASSDSFPKGRVYLPAKLFLGKEFGDSISFQHKGKSVMLTITKKFSQLDTMKEVLQTIELQKSRNPLFGAYDQFSWYHLGEKGSIYKYIKNEESGQFLLTEMDKSSLRKPIEPEYCRFDRLYLSESNLYKIIAEFPGVTLSDLDFILNEDHLIVYALAKPPKIEQEYRCTSAEIKWERVLKIKWQELFEESFEAMKTKLPHMSTSLEHGQLEIVFSLNEN